MTAWRFAFDRAVGLSMRALTREQLGGLAVVMLASFVAALDSSIVATVMPTVIGEVGGIDRYSLVFSAYLLVSTVAAPVVGRMADLFGRKPLYVGGMLVFMAGSLGAGASGGMDQLIVSRAIQGLGAGALLPVGSTIAGDLFDVKGRARVQPFLSAVWVTAALVGPAIGGIVTQWSSWRWAFLLNLPIGAVVIVTLFFAFQERVERRAERVDWLGAACLTLATGSLLLAIDGVVPPLMLALAVFGGFSFVRVERAAASPLVDLRLLRHPAVGPGIALNAVIGGMTFAVSTYLPLFVQGVQGRSPIEAGAIVSATSIGWSAGAIAMSAVLVRLGPRRSALLGTLFWAIGGAELMLIGPASPLLQVGTAVALIGLGMGFTIFPVLVSAQSAVGWSERGVVTGLVQFSRSLGAAVGVAALGGVLFATMGLHAAENVAALLDPPARRAFETVELEMLIETLGRSLHSVYLVMVCAAAVGALLAIRLPATFSAIARPDQRAADPLAEIRR